MGWTSSHRRAIAVPITVVEGNIKGRSRFRLRPPTTAYKGEETAA
ncbi:hypothetical protein NWP21_16330 [Anabaenopsis sp. FSS-46]|nr:hypothetical protein [Anabaenopsis sp. FSS-46]MDH6100377.1 hypothetical protein [Anabaenopsis sp. FSS-46]